MGYCRAAKITDATQLSPRLRQDDLNEIQARSGRDPKIVLLEGVVLSSPCYAIIGNSGAVEGLFGVSPIDEFSGSVWLLGSEALATPPLSKQFLRESRRFVDVLHLRYPILTNLIDERNTLHIRWLQWLGFTFFHRHAHYGFEQRPFLEFMRLQNV